MNAPVTTAGGTVSATGLLRSAGLAMRLWTAAGAPELFAALREHAAAQRRYAERAAAVADRIGTEVVPDPELPVALRRQALALRRTLHRASSPAPLGARERAAAQAIVEWGVCDLAAEITAVVTLAGDLAGDELSLSEAVRAEHDRLLSAPWELLSSAAGGRGAIADGTLAAAADVPARLAAGEPWTSKRMRKRSEYLWRMVARGATKTTPRAWLGHVAVLDLDAAAGDEPVVTPEVALQRMGNLYRARGRQARTAPDGELRWWFEPLHRMNGEHLQLWTLDEDDVGQATPVRLRATAPLLAVRGALRSGAARFDELAAAVLPPDAGDVERTALLALLHRLADLGVLGAGHSAPRTVIGWRPPADVPSEAVGPVAGVYVDVHRSITGGLPAGTGEAWDRDLRQLLRLHRLLRDDAGDRRGPQPPASERPVVDAIADHFDDLGRNGPRRPEYVESCWPRPVGPESGYAALVARIAGGATHIDAATLDAVGAPTAEDADLGWPLDCTLRPLPGGRAVLDTVQPAGVYDARFADAVHDLHGTPAHEADYRAFLDRLHAETGVESVELLVPPLAERAANSVRRPLYTPAWTGDPDLLGHCRRDGRRPRHLPLDELVLRIDGHERTVLHDGRPVRPLYHATRYPAAPWNKVYSLLMSASPQQRCRVRRLRHSIGALPGVDHLARITLGSSLVLAPEQWLVPVRLLAGLAGDGLGAVRAVDRLRTELGLPRWTFVSSRLGGKPVACDLESLRSVAVLLDAASRVPAEPDGPAEEPALIVEEMLPSPDELVVHDLLDGAPEPVAAEVLVRFATGSTPRT